MRHDVIVAEHDDHGLARLDIEFLPIEQHQVRNQRRMLTLTSASASADEFRLIRRQHRGQVVGELYRVERRISVRSLAGSF